MNTKTAGIALVIVVILAIGGWFALAAMPANAPSLPSEASTTTDSTNIPASPDAAGVKPATGEAATVIVSYSDSGFYPKDISIRVGDTVRFVNQSTHGMWVASDAHPTHTEYDGTDTHAHCANGAANNGTFDECTAVNNGASFEYTFLKTGSHEYHNHVRASDIGTITVQ